MRTLAVFIAYLVLLSLLSMVLFFFFLKMYHLLNASMVL